MSVLIVSTYSLQTWAFFSPQHATFEVKNAALLKQNVITLEDLFTDLRSGKTGVTTVVLVGIAADGCSKNVTQSQTQCPPLDKWLNYFEDESRVFIGGVEIGLGKQKAVKAAFPVLVDRSGLARQAVKLTSVGSAVVIERTGRIQVSPSMAWNRLVGWVRSQVAHTERDVK